uniref:Diacylglycerol kinase n=2 Tax=Aplanochytrium stocchinoi TaxID=215587 RepID=A0A6S8B0V1_9STRA|mmetsp:Transcript_6378/g.7724  ORF Transcript_6378/g.7724 Transcript_6378/m.7724 type:complete len:737 (-) Transcript_6378:984-3194(-)|eukprot:CAMPEP_0204834370 /NCGR_PEP_ID=MMETSP1346-20131115/19670_1 /ASSEMBLY_ACC=CAM_ASM_000771 /TAXON_ID=215587 /ORGANISM="Aplanochytrium stocchinoi, Strain GSBS06" /LENGTH=736 /DNA_ID=CAMNT_0051967663 /DNA_START=523 /DNA_END=2733 /DNA_ORIENTATION=+
MTHENIQVGGSDLATSFRLAFAGAEGVTGLPILQEISLAFFIICSLSLWLLLSGEYGPVIGIVKRKKDGGYKHIALPALVLSKSQRQRLAKLLLPAACVIEVSLSESESGEDEAPSIDGQQDQTDKKGQQQPGERGTIKNHAESNDAPCITDTTQDVNSENIEKRKTESISESTPLPRTPDADGKGDSSSSLQKRFREFPQSLRKLEKRMKRRLKYRRGHSRKPLKYIDNEKSRQALLGKTPLLVFVNKKSGGQQGELLLYQLRALLHHWQVYDLKKGHDPEVGLKFFAKVPMFRILIAGGDGTIAWVLETLDKMKLDYRPPVAILPLGTGNDLARVLGWGGGLQVGRSSALPLVSQLFEVAKAQLTLLDRWNVTFSNKKRKDTIAQASPSSQDRAAEIKRRLSGVDENHIIENNIQTENVHSRKVLNNYLGVGVDAQIALNFHLKRERAPHLFKNRYLNKFWYASSGGQEILMQRFIDFATHATLECDGKTIPIPVGCEGLIVLNIDSYGGGVDLWCGKSDDDANPENDNEDYDDNDMETEMTRSRSFSFNSELRQRPSTTAMEGKNKSKMQSYNDLHYEAMKKAHKICEPERQVFQIPSYQDKLLEVVAVSSSFQLGAAQVGLARPMRLCQGSRIRITTGKSLPVQVDGEPFIMDPNQCIDISHRNQAHVLSMAHLVDEIDKHKVTADVIDWAFTSAVIDTRQRDLLLSEISRRIQNARVRSTSMEDDAYDDIR